MQNFVEIRFLEATVAIPVIKNKGMPIKSIDKIATL